MKRVLELARDDERDTNVFPCKRLRQLQSALGQRYEKRFVPSYPFDAALESDTDAHDLPHPDIVHASPGDTKAGLGWATDVAVGDVGTSSFTLFPFMRTATSRLLPARWEDSDAESDLDSEPEHGGDADMDPESSPSSSPPPATPPTHAGQFGFTFSRKHGRGYTVPRRRAAVSVPVVSCAHPVLCCAMCGIRVVRVMCEIGIQAEEVENETSSTQLSSAMSTHVPSSHPSPPPVIVSSAVDDDVDMDLEEDESMVLTTRPPSPSIVQSCNPPPSNSATLACKASRSTSAEPASVLPAGPRLKGRTDTQPVSSSPTAPDRGKSGAMRLPASQAAGASTQGIRGSFFPCDQERHPGLPSPSLDSVLGRPVPKGPRALTSLQTASPRSSETPLRSASAAARKGEALDSAQTTSQAPVLGTLTACPSPPSGVRASMGSSFKPVTSAHSGSLKTYHTGPAKIDVVGPPQPKSEPPPLPPGDTIPNGVTCGAHPPEPAAPPPPLPSQAPPAKQAWHVPLASASYSPRPAASQPSEPVLPPPPLPAQPPKTVIGSSSAVSHSYSPWQGVPPGGDISVTRKFRSPGLGTGAIAHTVSGFSATHGRMSASPPEPSHPPPPLPILPPPPETSLLPSSSVGVTGPSSRSTPQGAALTDEELQKDRMRAERRRRKREREREKKREFKKEAAKQGIKLPPPKVSLPLRREGNDFQCPIDCRWFSMVGFLGHFDMKHEGRSNMTRRVKDELVKKADVGEFWRQFWTHCDLRPEECHPHYVRIDYESVHSTSEDMEDGEIVEAQKSGSPSGTKVS